MKPQNFYFGKVGLLPGDPSRMIRQGLKGALFNEGFRNILDTGKLPDISHRKNGTAYSHVSG